MSLFSNSNIKQLKLSALFILSPLFFFAQSLTGLWTGTLSNDSTTIRKDQSFEIALTEYRGKVYGYSRSEFIVNDTLFYIVKRVKGTIDGDVCEVTDDDILAYNFRGKLDKGVKVISTFRRNQTDSTWFLDGTWKTNATKKYYSVTGKVGLQEEKDLTASKIFPHLEELNLANNVAFYKERKEEPVIVRIAKPEKIKTEYNDRPQPVLINNDVAIVPAKPIIQKAEAGPVPVSTIETIADIADAESITTVRSEKIPVADLPKTDIKNIPSSSVAVNPTPVSKILTEAKKPDLAESQDNTITSVASKPIEEKRETQSAPIAKAEVKKDQPVVKSQPQPVKQPETDVNKPETKSIASVNDPVPEKKETQSTTITKVEVKKDQPVAKTQPQPIRQPETDVNKPDIKTVAVKNNPVTEKKETQSTTITKVEVKKDQPVAKTQPQPIKQPDVVINKPETKTVAVINNSAPEKKETIAAVTPVAEVKKEQSVADVIEMSAVIDGRKSEFTQVVNFKTDSLILSLYDNGEIDGDTVSVFMNGEVLMAKQGLKSKAIKKTIYINPNDEEFTLVMFADNLGKYPPNTGLLVVHDGEDVYNLRFSSDLKKSAGIVFKRKK